MNVGVASGQHDDDEDDDEASYDDEGDDDDDDTLEHRHVWVAVLAEGLQHGAARSVAAVGRPRNGHDDTTTGLVVSVATSGRSVGARGTADVGRGRQALGGRVGLAADTHRNDSWRHAHTHTQGEGLFCKLAWVVGVFESSLSLRMGAARSLTKHVSGACVCVKRCGVEDALPAVRRYTWWCAKTDATEKKKEARCVLLCVTKTGRPHVCASARHNACI